MLHIDLTCISTAVTLDMLKLVCWNEHSLGYRDMAWFKNCGKKIAQSFFSGNSGW